MASPVDNKAACRFWGIRHNDFNSYIETTVIVYLNKSKLDDSIHARGSWGSQNPSRKRHSVRIR